MIGMSLLLIDPVNTLTGFKLIFRRVRASGGDIPGQRKRA